MVSTSQKFNGADVDVNRLREVLEYRPDTGEFFWRKRLSNRVKVGDRAGTKGANGYIYIRFDGYMLLAHRLAWLYVHKEYPSLAIDHINGERSDNRMLNLRLATISQNAMNGVLRNTNKSGYRGVSWDKGKNKWVARIVKDRKQHVLGRFPTKEAAYDAYLSAAETLHGEFGREYDKQK
jgi:hypothetical protein